MARISHSNNDNAYRTYTMVCDLHRASCTGEHETCCACLTCAQFVLSLCLACRVQPQQPHVGVCAFDLLFILLVYIYMQYSYKHTLVAQIAVYLVSMVHARFMCKTYRLSVWCLRKFSKTFVVASCTHIETSSLFITESSPLLNVFFFGMYLIYLFCQLLDTTHTFRFSYFQYHF